MKNGYSVETAFGGRKYYDENGELTGYSVESAFGGRQFYDKDGNRWDTPRKPFSAENSSTTGTDEAPAIPRKASSADVILRQQRPGIGIFC